MASRPRSARAAARWYAPDDLWLDHALLTADDLTWLEPVERLTMWAVKVPLGLLAAMPRLDWLDVRGGTGSDLRFLAGCERLRYLCLNQIRGLHDLTGLDDLTSLMRLDLFGLPQVEQIPSLRRLDQLRRAQLGSMKGLCDLTGLLEAPVLEELLLSRRIGVLPGEAARVAAHPTISRFLWDGMDVPVRQWVPFTEAVGLPPAEISNADEWFDRL